MKVTIGISIEIVIVTTPAKEVIVPPYVVLEDFVAPEMLPKMETAQIQPWIHFGESIPIPLGNIFA